MRISVQHHSFLTARTEDLGVFDAIVMNPPYNKNMWQAFTDKAITLLDPTSANAQLFAVLPQRDEPIPYEPVEALTAPFKFEGLQQGRQQVAVVFRMTLATTRTTAPVALPALLIPGLTLTRISNRYKCTPELLPCIVFPQLVATARLAQNSTPVSTTAELTYERVGDGALFILTGPNLLPFSECLKAGGMQFIMSRRAAQRTAINKLTGRGTYREKDLIPWLNEAWTNLPQTN